MEILLSGCLHFFKTYMLVVAVVASEFGHLHTLLLAALAEPLLVCLGYLLHERISFLYI